MKLSKVGKTSQKCAWTAVATRASSKKFVNFRLTTKVHELYCGSAKVHELLLSFFALPAGELKFMNFTAKFMNFTLKFMNLEVHELYEYYNPRTACRSKGGRFYEGKPSELWLGVSFLP